MKKEFLNLGKQPIANKFLRENEFEDEFFYDLKVVFDEDTKLVSTEVEFDTASQKTGLMRLTYLISYSTVENAVQTGV